MRHWKCVWAIASSLLLAGTCGCGGKKSSSSSSSGDGGGPVRSSLISDERAKSAETERDAKEAAARAMIDKFMAAAKAGDVEAGKKLCSDSLARRLTNAKPRNFEYEIRDVQILPQSTLVHVWQKYPDITDQNNRVLIEYTLMLYGQEWRIISSRVKSDWEND
ncbi:MAG: hypothetical protein BIFFINMI_02988 [Phycisphaerae bacterium]|nr:hypothetical protein [Phycisphaerae bacterium]